MWNNLRDKNKTGCEALSWLHLEHHANLDATLFVPALWADYNYIVSQNDGEYLTLWLQTSYSKPSDLSLNCYYFRPS